MASSPGLREVGKVTAGSGPAAATMNNVAVTLTGVQVQSEACGMYDPVVEQKPAQVIQGFCSPSMDVPSACMLIGALLIVYGVIAK
jgi:hypothetical protein